MPRRVLISTMVFVGLSALAIVACANSSPKVSPDIEQTQKIEETRSQSQEVTVTISQNTKPDPEPEDE